MDIVKDFLDALKQSDQDRLRELAGRFPELADLRNDEGISLVLLATYYRNRETVDALVKVKKHFDLFEASATGALAAVRQILEGGKEDVNAFSPDGYTAAGLASYFSRLEALKLLFSFGADINLPARNPSLVCPIHSAAAVGDLRIAAWLVRQGADVDARQMNGITALHSAAHRGDLEMARILVEAGADLKARTDNDRSALDMALEAGHEHIVNFLQRMKHKSKN